MYKFFWGGGGGGKEKKLQLKKCYFTYCIIPTNNSKMMKIFLISKVDGQSLYYFAKLLHQDTSDLFLRVTLYFEAFHLLNLKMR